LPQAAYVFKMAVGFDRSHCNKLKSGVPRWHKTGAQNMVTARV